MRYPIGIQSFETMRNDGGTAQEALQQIADRGYAKAYEADTRTVHKIGASFSSKTGTVEEWLLSEE